MKFCRFEVNNQVNEGCLIDGKIHRLEENSVSQEFFELADVKLLLPVEPTKIICVGRNYADHAAELGNEVPKEPLLFLKANSSLLLDGSPIVIPPQSNQVEHEGELGVVIKKQCKNLNDTVDLTDYIFGYICLNDVTARDVQKNDIQFTRGKSFDSFCPIGSFIETELDVTDLSVETRVNGIVKQYGRTSQMVFPVDFLVRYISRQMTLLPGDIIATGTPSGVSKLVAGDLCEVEIEGIGILKNAVKNII